MKKAIFLLLLVVPAPFAAGVEVIPDTMVFRGKAGERFRRGITLTQNESVPVECRLQIFLKRGEQLLKDFKTVQIFPEKIRLNPGESQSAAIACQIPRAKGEILAALQVIYLNNKSGEDWIETHSLHLIYLQVAGTELASARFTGLSARRENSGVHIDVSLKNTGNIHLQPKFVAEMNRKGGGKAFEIFKGPMAALFPGESASFSAILNLTQSEAASSTGAVTGFFRNAEGAVQSVRENFQVQ